VRVGAYPGTFDPPTVAHLAIAEAALVQGRLDRVDLVVSAVPLGKDPVVPTLDDRIDVLERIASTRPWLGVRVTPLRLIADIAQGYQAVVVGADKWLQVTDLAWYESEDHRDRAVAGLPDVLLVPRPPSGDVRSAGLPQAGSIVLAIDERYAHVSSSEVRRGRREWMADEAFAFDVDTGAWSEPERYLRGAPRD
jgi:nicotinic acid mononucleotide adenylyltransferase